MASSGIIFGGAQDENVSPRHEERGEHQAERVFTSVNFSSQTARILPTIITAFQLGAIYLD